LLPYLPRFLIIIRLSIVPLTRKSILIIILNEKRIEVDNNTLI